MNNFKDMSFLGKCDVCGEETDVAACCSALGPISFAYCEDCFRDGLEPYWAMVAYTACAGRFPDDINETYRVLCRDILDKLGVSEVQFITDIDNKIKEVEEYYCWLEAQDE